MQVCPVRKRMLWYSICKNRYLIFFPSVKRNLSTQSCIWVNWWTCVPDVMYMISFSTCYFEVLSAMYFWWSWWSLQAKTHWSKNEVVLHTTNVAESTSAVYGSASSVIPRQITLKLHATGLYAKVTGAGAPPWPGADDSAAVGLRIFYVHFV